MRTGMRGGRIAAAAIAVALTAAACGRSGSSGASGDGTSSTTQGGSAPAAATTADFGTLTDVCGPGTAGPSGSQGVTADAVKVGVFSDAGAQFRPGLNQELFDVGTVFSKWCNDRGGLDGRKIVVDPHDAGLFEVKARMLEACRDDFYLVGGGAVFDQDGVQPRLQCLLPEVPAYVVSDQARGADLSTPGNPNPLGTMTIGALRYLDRKYPADTDHIGLLTGDVNTTKVVAGYLRDAATEELGWRITYDDVYPAAGVADWTPYAQKLRDADVKGLIWVGEPESLAKLLGALGDIGYRLDFIRTDANHYDQNLIKNAGASLAPKNVYIQSAFHPFENAAPSSATGQYLKAFEEYLPDGKKQTYLGLQAWSSWLLFAKAASSCGNDLTRRCLYDAAKKVHSWTGGGLHAESDPGATKATECYAVMLATPNGFTLVKDTKPNEGIFNCSPKNVFQLPASEAVHTTLADVGQNINNMK